MSNYYVMAGGGLGDLIFHYFKQPRWGVLQEIKKQDPAARIAAIVACHHPSGAELLYTNPFIDGVMAYPWYPPGHEKERLWLDLIKGSSVDNWLHSQKERGNDCQHMRAQLWLTEAEKREIDVLFGKTGRLIVIHPFAGLPHRGCLRHPIDGQYKCYPDYKYMQSANFLAEEGYTVVFVGRTSHDGQDGLRSYPEILDTPITPHPNVISMINKTSLRVNVALCRKANGFLGTHSSMLSAAWTADTPSVFFYPKTDEHGNIRGVMTHGGTTGTWALDRPYHRYFELTSEEFLELNPLLPAQTLLEYVR